MSVEPLLSVSNIETFYGPIQAIRGISLEVPQGKIITVLGANGAGKTTILKTISGVMDPERGVAILLVEQNAHIALKTADYGYIIEVGRIVMEGLCSELMEKDDIKEFYLGQKQEGVRAGRRWKRKKLWR